MKPNTPQGYSDWVAEGKERGYLDYWKDLTRHKMQEEIINDLPVGFLRQWINEDVKKDGRPLVTDEDILEFIRLGVKGQLKMQEDND